METFTIADTHFDHPEVIYYADRKPWISYPLAYKSDGSIDIDISVNKLLEI